MKPRNLLAVLLPVFTFVGGASAQGKPTASRGIAPTAFVLVTGTGTGVGGGSRSELPGGKNVAITAGLDVDFYAIGPYRIGAEVRGSYPLDFGTIVGERDIVGGARVSYETAARHAIRPYLDAHFGRGQMNYVQGYQVGNLLYQQTASNIYGGGGGAEFDVTDQFSLKLDAQAHHWSTPVVTGNSVWAGQVSVGVAYRIFANKGPR